MKESIFVGHFEHHADALASDGIHIMAMLCRLGDLMGAHPLHDHDGVAGIIAIAMSMGEFGASWILVRTGAWDTLPVLVDQLMTRPGFDPLVKPTAMAAASLLMFTTLVLFLLAERFRPDGDGGMF